MTHHPDDKGSNIPENKSSNSSPLESEISLISTPINRQLQWRVVNRLIDEHRSSYEALRLSDHFNRPQIIEEGNNFDDLARGMHTQPQEASDKYFTKEVSIWVLLVYQNS